jgi:integrase/recombinase XerD
LQYPDAIEQFRVYQHSLDLTENTIHAYRNDLLFFSKYLSDTYNYTPYLTDVTTEDFENYLSHLKDRLGYTAASRKRKLAVFRTFMNFCMKKKYTFTNPAVLVDSIKVKHQERLYLDEKEVMQIIENITHPLVKLVVFTLYYTGMRISECIHLKLNDVHFERNEIRVVDGKGKKERLIPISHKLLPHIKQYKEHVRPYTKSDNFFCTATSGGISAPYVNRLLCEATRQLGWSLHVTCHTMRHAFASNLVKRNIHVVQIQKLLGHTSLTTTSIYTHAKFEDLALAVNQL